MEMGDIRRKILIIESSQIVFEGLSNIVSKVVGVNTIFKINDIEELTKAIRYNKFDIIIINAAQILNRISFFKKIKMEYPAIRWLTIITNLVDDEIVSLFDGVIRIDDTEDEIDKIINNVGNQISVKNNQPVKENTLSIRETDVLVQLVKGFSNKEIADNLNISVHTVISHRKNISQKTGIKSQSGLTIYAISNKIVDIDKL